MTLKRVPDKRKTNTTIEVSSSYYELMIYVALLRGINVGGKTRVEMPKLKTSFESIGCKNVSTYINSGNVIFQDKRRTSQLVDTIEQVILKSFGFNVRVVLRNYPSINTLVKAVPKGWTNNSVQKTDVIFLWDEINRPEIIKNINYNPEIEKVLFIDGAIVWNIGRQNVTRGGGIKLIKTDLYQHMTIRNINTVRKLDLLMQKMI